MAKFGEICLAGHQLGFTLTPRRAVLLFENLTARRSAPEVSCSKIGA